MTGWALFREVIGALIAVGGFSIAIGFVILGVKLHDHELQPICYMLGLVTSIAPLSIAYWVSGPAWVFVLTVFGVGSFGVLAYRILPNE
jgi:hypothetical protein